MERSLKKQRETEQKRAEKYGGEEDDKLWRPFRRTRASVCSSGGGVSTSCSLELPPGCTKWEMNGRKARVIR